MRHHAHPPPPEPLCLKKPYLSSQKGGTLIANDVNDIETHTKKICNPDGYRPQSCPKCKHQKLHVHDYRERSLWADPLIKTIRIIRYICVGCKATWRILPAFVARWLWRRWTVVEAHCLTQQVPPSWPPVPERTKRRWKTRLSAAASFLLRR